MYIYSSELIYKSAVEINDEDEVIGYMRKLFALLLPILIGILSLPLACGGSSDQAGATTFDNLRTEAADVKIGSSVGSKVPDISMGLIDGSTVKSSELIASGQPTFLFFFATW